MGILDNLQSILGASSAPSGQGGGLGSILGPGVIGGLLGAILPGKGGMLKTGAAAALASVLWNKYQNSISVPPAASGQPTAYNQSGAGAYTRPAAYGQPAAFEQPLAPELVRLIRAMIFAAKSDGVIDEEEKAAIRQRLEGQAENPALIRLMEQLVNEPVDPALVAAGVSSPQESLQLFLASCAVIKMDTFMENSYIDALAAALGIPQEMKREVRAEAARAALPQR